MRPFGILGVAAIAACLAAIPQVTSAAVAPRNASDLVTLLSGAPGTGGCAAGKPIDIRTMPDGFNQPFTIPAKMVLVLTGIEWFSTSTGTGTSVIQAVFLQAPVGTLTLYSSHVQSTSAGAGYAGQQSIIPNVVVKGGVPLCVTQFIDNAPGGGSPGYTILHGFLVDDN